MLGLSMFMSAVPVMARASSDGRFSEGGDKAGPSAGSSEMPRLFVEAMYGILELLRSILDRDRVAHFKIV